MGAWSTPKLLAFLCEAYIAHSAQHTTVYDMQGWQSRSGRPGNRRTIVLTAWDDVADTSLAGEKHAYHQHRFVPAQTSQSESKRELRRPENKQIVGAVAMPTFLTSVAQNKIQSSNKLILCAASLSMYLKPPMPMDTNLHGVVVKRILLLIMPRLKWRCFRPKLAPEPIYEYQIFHALA